MRCFRGKCKLYGCSIAAGEAAAGTVVFPGVSRSNFILSTDKNILQAEVVDFSGRQFQRFGKQEQGLRTSFGQQRMVWNHALFHYQTAITLYHSNCLHVIYVDNL